MRQNVPDTAPTGLYLAFEVVTQQLKCVFLYYFINNLNVNVVNPAKTINKNNHGVICHELYSFRYNLVVKEGRWLYDLQEGKWILMAK